PLHVCFVMLRSIQGLSYTDRCAPRPTLFPYTTVFRSSDVHQGPALCGILQQPGMEGRYQRGALAASGQIAPLVPAYHAWLLQDRSEEHTSELQSRENLVCRLLLETKI